MRLGEYLRKDFVLDDLQAGDKQDALAELCRPGGRRVPRCEPLKAWSVLMDRESLGTTGIGDGVAIPHGKMVSSRRSSSWPGAA